MCRLSNQSISEWPNNTHAVELPRVAALRIPLVNHSAHSSQHSFSADLLIVLLQVQAAQRGAQHRTQSKQHPSPVCEERPPPLLAYTKISCSAVHDVAIMKHRQGAMQGTACAGLSMHRTSLCTFLSIWESRKVREQLHNAETSSPARRAVLDQTLAEDCIRQAAGCNATQLVSLQQPAFLQCKEKAVLLGRSLQTNRSAHLQ